MLLWAWELKKRRFDMFSILSVFADIILFILFVVVVLNTKKMSDDIHALLEIEKRKGQEQK